ncbi:hypothetical protein CALCODRAFT_120452 [Calocera cornea HHB12733]|uniref:Uncharacterized protein n=1 Tax=Calocera cornea HHB12733 TaxID=1353952 RepID=A0A165IF21_9BASI|nr:hypothetical protein CALCODRAFT_120452 [Calocera cornea HHB12733]
MLTSYIATSAVRCDPSLPKRTSEIIASISQNTLFEWATRVLRIVDSERLVGGRNAGPVACAAMLLALEAASEVKLSGIEALARLLANRLGTRAFTVMERYNEMVKMLSAFKAEVQPLVFDTAPSYRGSAAIRRTSSHPTWLKDVLVLAEEICEKHTQEAQGAAITSSTSPPDALIAESAHSNDVCSAPKGADSEYWTRVSEDDEEVDVDSTERSASASTSKTSFLVGDTARHAVRNRSIYSRPPRPNRRPAPEDTTLRSAYTLLAPTHTSADPYDDVAAGSFLLRTDAPPSDAVHLLRFGSRLSRLAAERGGEDRVEDHELFSDGELDSYIARSDVSG